MKKTILILVLLNSCVGNKHKKLLITPASINLGNINARPNDTLRYKFSLTNNSESENILIKGISSSCACTIIDNNSFMLLPKESKILNGILIVKREDAGLVSQKVSIHSDGDSIFQFVTISATIIR